MQIVAINTTPSHMAIPILYPFFQPQATQAGYVHLFPLFQVKKRFPLEKKSPRIHHTHIFTQAKAHIIPYLSIIQPFGSALHPPVFADQRFFHLLKTPKLALISRNSYVTPPFFLSIPTTLLSSPKFPPLFPLHSSTTASPSSNRAQSRRPPSALPIPRPTTPALRVAIFLFFHREHAIALFLVDATGSDAGRGDSSVKAAVGAVACGCGDGAEGIFAAIVVFGIGGIRTRRKAGAG